VKQWKRPGLARNGQVAPGSHSHRRLEAVYAALALHGIQIKECDLEARLNSRARSG